MMKQHKGSEMNDEKIWDYLLNSEEGVDVFDMLIQEAKQEVADGKSEPL